MKAINHKGYFAKVEFDPEDHIFVGHVIGIKDVIGFHGESVAELETAFHDAVDNYLEACKELGQKPNKPYSGNLMLRVPAEVHAAVAASTAAPVLKASINGQPAFRRSQATPIEICPDVMRMEERYAFPRGTVGKSKKESSIAA